MNAIATIPPTTKAAITPVEKRACVGGRPDDPSAAEPEVGEDSDAIELEEEGPASWAVVLYAIQSSVYDAAVDAVVMFTTNVCCPNAISFDW